jgi:hydrogenase/urease accessory protein HupE
VIRSLLAFLLAFGFLSAPVCAHELSMAEMEVREISRGDFLWQWAATNDKRPGATELKPQWPESCAVEESLLHCGDRGLYGELSIAGVGEKYSAAIVKVFWADGQRRVYTLTAGQPSVQFYGGAEDRRGMTEIASAYGVLGVEHILSGFDHLAFVLALLFLVGFKRRLVLTISAFTIAHSLTLALSAMGLLTLRSPPVEATIALSIMLVAAEALHGRSTASRRWPALVAFLFGLVHGLGFAGALKDIGLPENHLPVALLTFNLGVEFGQLLVVAAALLVVKAVSRWPKFELARTPSLYAIGSVAAFWTVERIAGIVAA